jgi:hypothetical protein
MTVDAAVVAKAATCAVNGMRSGGAPDQVAATAEDTPTSAVLASVDETDGIVLTGSLCGTGSDVA